MRRALSVVSVMLALCWWGASVAAATTGAPPHAVREMTGLRTASSRTWQVDSGKRLTRFYDGQVNWRDAHGHWRAIDPTFAADPKKATFEASIGSDRQVQIPLALSPSFAELSVSAGAEATLSLTLEQ